MKRNKRREKKREKERKGEKKREKEREKREKRERKEIEKREKERENRLGQVGGRAQRVNIAGERETTLSAKHQQPAEILPATSIANIPTLLKHFSLSDTSSAFPPGVFTSLV